MYRHDNPQASDQQQSGKVSTPFVRPSDRVLALPSLRVHLAVSTYQKLLAFMHLHWWRWNCTENVVENMRVDILGKKCYHNTGHELKLSKTKRSFWYQNLSVLSAKSSQINRPHLIRPLPLTPPPPPPPPQKNK